MKTFEEVMQMRMFRTDGPIPLEVPPPGREMFERYESLVREIGENEMTQAYILAIASIQAPSNADPDRIVLSLLLTAFVNGIMVGIEMEKSE